MNRYSQRYIINLGTNFSKVYNHFNANVLELFLKSDTHIQKAFFLIHLKKITPRHKQFACGKSPRAKRSYEYVSDCHTG